MKKILLTGADGFIGSHLLEKLISNNYNVKALVQYNSFNSFGWIDHIDKRLLKKTEVVLGDLRDPENINKITKDCSVVLHLGALISIPYSYSAVSSYLDTNVRGTLNILECCKKMNGKLKMIHTSTSEVYGSAKYVPIDENHPLQAQSPYAATKIAADKLAESFYKSFDLPITTIRPFNAFGPRQSNRAVIPSIINQIYNEKSFVKIGSLYPKRDFNYVSDICNAYLSAIKKDNIYGETFNIGSGYEISIDSLLKTLFKISGVTKEIITDEIKIRPKKSEVDRLLADNKKAKKFLNWSPKFSGKKGLTKYLKITLDWFKNNDNLSLYKNNYLHF